jgi:hypothetical protein
MSVAEGAQVNLPEASVEPVEQFVGRSHCRVDRVSVSDIETEAGVGQSIEEGLQFPRDAARPCGSPCSPRQAACKALGTTQDR